MPKLMLVVLSCMLVAMTSSCASKTCDDTCAQEGAIAQKFVHRYGVEVAQNEWNKRGKSGHVVSTLKTGVTVTKNYLDGFLHGETTYTHPHSQTIQFKEIYSQGELEKQLEYSATGILKKQTSYNNPTSYEVTVWYENGVPHSRELYEDDKIQNADYYDMSNQVEARVNAGEGKRINRDSFGDLLSIDKIENGELVLRTVLYSNGAPKEMIPYKNGKITGEKRTFFPDGEPNTVEGWFNGQQEGITIQFQNGEKAAEVPYLKGSRDGIEVRYRDGQFIVEEVTWKKGYKHGPCTRYIGGETVVDWYFDGVEIPKSHFDRLTNPRVL